MRNITSLAVLLGLFLPAIAYAARDLRSIICQLVGIIDRLVPIIMGLALLYFFWGLGRFILNSDSEEERTRGRRIMFWGSVAFFVALSIFGIVEVLLNTFFGGTPGGFDANFICGLEDQTMGGDEEFAPGF